MALIEVFHVVASQYPIDASGGDLPQGRIVTLDATGNVTFSGDISASNLSGTNTGDDAGYEPGGTDVAVADGGTGASDAATARTNLGVDPAGTDNSTDVTLAGTPDYLTLSGQEITLGQIDLTTDVTGDLPVAEGGTGSSTAGGARTNLGLVIGTDVQAWDNDLDDIAALTPTKGNVLVGDGTDWTALGVGTDTHVLTADSAQASGIKWAAGGGGGGATVTVDTEDNIFDLSPTAGDMAFATDRGNYAYLYEGSSWYKSTGGWGSVTGQDIGLTKGNSPGGYGTKTIWDKYAYNFGIGSSDREETGGLRIDSTNSPTTFEIYLGGEWKTIIYDFTTDEGYFVHYPYSTDNAVYVWAGNSVDNTLSGYPRLSQYSEDMGAYSSPVAIDCGTF